MGGSTVRKRTEEVPDSPLYPFFRKIPRHIVCGPLSAPQLKNKKHQYS